MRDIIIHIEDYNGNELMSFRVRSVGNFMRLRDLHDCNVVDRYDNEDGDTIFIIQSKNETSWR